MAAGGTSLIFAARRSSGVGLAGSGPEGVESTSARAAWNLQSSVPHRPGMLQVSRRPLLVGYACSKRWEGRLTKSEGKKELKKVCTSGSLRARPAPEMRFTWGVSLFSGILPSCSRLSHKVSGIVLNSSLSWVSRYRSPGGFYIMQAAATGSSRFTESIPRAIP